MSLFGKDNDREILGKLTEISEHLRKHDEALRHIGERLDALAANFDERHGDIAATISAHDCGDVFATTKNDDASPECSAPVSAVYFLSAPTPDGVFHRYSDVEQIGKSVYRLVTTDGLNGSFSMLSSEDAAATALLSVTQIIKPACRIVSGSNPSTALPRSITTVKEGRAVYDGEAWKVTEKAVIAM